MLQSEHMSKASFTHGVTIAWVLAAIVTLPLLGVMVAGRAIHPYLEFPPMTHSVTHEPFSWAVFIAAAGLVVATLVPFFATMLRMTRYGYRIADEAIPLVGLGCDRLDFAGLVVSLEQARLDGLDSRADVYAAVAGLHRHGQCSDLPAHRPLHDAAPSPVFSFPFSAQRSFWWSFEYLNRFVQNWYYLGGRELTAWEYLWQATLPFRLSCQRYSGQLNR